MKTLLITVLSIIVLTGTFLYIFQNFISPSNGQNWVSPAALIQSPDPSAEIQSPLPVPAIPRLLSIPDLNVEAIVEDVGLDNENKMDVPKNAMNAGWYNLGVKPGETGNAVMAGHLDKKDGSPAIFYNLTKLKKGDILQVTDNLGQQYRYIVTETKSYALKDFPLQEVFGPNSKARLNLITCEGNFNKSSNLYSHRFVVYSELEK